MDNRKTKTMKKIKQILVDGQGWIYSEDGEIVRINVNGEMGFVNWFRQGNKEFNGKYVIEIEYE